MSRRSLRLACWTTVTIAAVTAPLIGLDNNDSSTALATAYLETLESDEVVSTSMEFADDKRTDWHFIPKAVRKGLPLGAMDDEEKTAALRLVKTCLSEAGYEKADQIMNLEDLLRLLEGEDRNWARDSGLYYVTVFGEPGPSTRWGLSFEGHHLSLNFVFDQGKIVDSTPQFLAANPGLVTRSVPSPEGMTVAAKGTRVLRDEELLGFELVNALDASQAERAIIHPKAPAEIRYAGVAQPKGDDTNQIEAPAGIAWTDLSPDQQRLLEQLCATYFDVATDEVATKRREEFQAQKSTVHFAWAGATKPGIGHYYRIQGKTFLIEFVNSQPDAIGTPANHIHCVLRDLTGDFDLPITK